MKTHQDSFSEFEKSKHDEKNTSNDDETTSNRAEAAEVFDSDINSEDIFEETSEFEYKNRYHIKEEEDYDDYEHREYDEEDFYFPDVWDAFDVDPDEFGGDEDALFEYFGY